MKDYGRKLLGFFVDTHKVISLNPKLYHYQYSLPIIIIETDSISMGNEKNLTSDTRNEHMN